MRIKKPRDAEELATAMGWGLLYLFIVAVGVGIIIVTCLAVYGALHCC